MNKTFTIKRSEWLRGKTGTLCTTERGFIERCCLGFRGNQLCEIDDLELRRASTPDGTTGMCNPTLWGDLLQLQSGSRNTGVYANSDICRDIIEVNDDPAIFDDYREAELTRIFALIGETPVFVD